MLPFYTTSGFLVLSGGIKWEHWLEMGWKNTMWGNDLSQLTRRFRKIVLIILHKLTMTKFVYRSWGKLQSNVWYLKKHYQREITVFISLEDGDKCEKYEKQAHLKGTPDS